MTRRSHALPVIAFIAFATANGAVGATTHSWPGDVPCNGSLQDCVNSTGAFDTVQISGSPGTLVAVSEDIMISGPLTLSVQAGVDAVFSSGHSITVNSPLFGDSSVTLQGMTMDAGNIVIVNNTNEATTYTVENVRMRELKPGADCAIDIRSFTDGTTTFNVANSVIEANRLPASGNPDGICVLASAGGSATTNVYGNYVRVGAASLFEGISVQTTTAGGTSSIYGNTVFGGVVNAGIDVGQSLGGPLMSYFVHDNWVQGQGGSASNPHGALAFSPAHADAYITNNSFTHNDAGIEMEHDDVGDTITGRIANNLIAFNKEGIALPTAFDASIGNGYNLLFGNFANQFTPGTGTLTSDPKLSGFADAHLLATSPAIDAGHNADVALFSSDADGEGRTANGTVDIGAYEYRGQQTVVHTTNAGNTVFNYSDVTLANVDSGSLLLATPHHLAGISSSEATQNVGVYLSGDLGTPWSVYYENSSVPITPGRKFSVTSIGFGSARFLHLSSLANDTANFSQMSNAALPALSDLVLGVTHNYNPGGVAGTYYDERIGFNFFSGHWYLQNQNAADDFQSGRYFNVLVEPLLATNAFKVSSSIASKQLMLQHPLLDDIDCAAPQVFRDSTGTADDAPLSVEYVASANGSVGHWYVDAEPVGGPNSIPAGAVINVIVDGSQTNGCRNDRIFANGFQ